MYPICFLFQDAEEYDVSLSGDFSVRLIWGVPLRPEETEEGRFGAGKYMQSSLQGGGLGCMSR
jgi:hypothetical protein